MGCSISKQVEFLISSEENFTYQDKERCATSGKTLQYFLNPAEDEISVFEKCTNEVFADVIEQRRDVMASKLKYREMDVDSIRSKYPHWTDEMVLDLKAQFQSFDLNLDGLIDFNELSMVLDELGDTSNEADRRKYFDQLDDDQSGAIDFEEYLELIDSVLTGKSKLNKLGQICKVGSENAQKLRRLSIVQQIDCGLF